MEFNYDFEIIDSNDENGRYRRPRQTGVGKKRRSSASPLLVVLVIILFLTSATLGAAFYFNTQTIEAQQETIRSLSGNVAELNESNVTMSGEIVELNEANDNLSASNERLSSDVELLSSILDENELRREIINLFEAKNSTYTVLKKIYPDKQVLLDDGGFTFHDINRDLKLCDYEKENFVYYDDSGRMAYTEDGKVVSEKGFDVSKFNHEIDWAQAADAGWDFAFIRLGVRGYVTGEIVKDEFFDANVKGAKENDIDLGVYFFSQAIDRREAEEEADFVIDLLKENEVSCPVVLDIEKIDNPDTTPRTLSLTPEERTDIALAFCDRIREAGYEPMIYGNLYTFLKLLELSRLEDVDKWYAGYINEEDRQPYFAYRFRIWQYTSAGAVPGISGKVDLNIKMY
ncbi:MAG: glycoside hydrolase family 25 protein [Lachnospiraceae bacterium]|nr:glycoside hydrolase family 25 protein [Lachnospiraceae bacterium]